MSTAIPPSDPWPRLFQIGTRLLDLADWIVVDERLPAYLEEKARLLAGRPDEVFMAEAGTEAAQAEVLALLAAHLPAHFPETYRRAGDAIEIVPAGRRVGLVAPGVPPLLTAAALVQEDLVVMRRGEAGWRLAAASLSFPSSWRLSEKFGRPIHDVHAPVPGFGAGTRNAELIARMFDNMRPETPMLRWNWSLYGDDALFHPHESPPRRFGAGPRADPVFLRAERQTLRRLPESGDILFTIRVHLEPLEALDAAPEAKRIAAALGAQLQALDEAQLAYKGMTAERGRVLARLAEIAER